MISDGCFRPSCEAKTSTKTTQKDEQMYTMSQRIEMRINEAGLRASVAILNAVEKFNPPRWMIAIALISLGQVFLLDLKGELSLRNWAVETLGAIMSLIGIG